MFAPIQTQNELEYVKNKKNFSPKEPVVVMKKIMKCTKSRAKKPYSTFLENNITHVAKIAYAPQKQAVTNLLYFCF